jgi:hypothetical protein
MQESTQTLGELSSELCQQVESLRALADSVGTAPVSDIRDGLDRLDTFVSIRLLPHISALREALGGPEDPSLAMDLSHLGSLAGEVGWLRRQLSSRDMTVGSANAVRRVLYGLYALLKVHFAKEGELYLPLINAQTEDSARQQEAG